MRRAMMFVALVVVFPTPAKAQVHVDVGVFTPSVGVHVALGSPRVHVLDPYYEPFYGPYYDGPVHYPRRHYWKERAKRERDYDREDRKDLREARREYAKHRRQVERAYWKDLREARREYEKDRRKARGDWRR